VIVVGLGGNVGSHAAIVERFRRARDALAALGRARSASLYRSAPIGPAQPPYLNSAVALVLDPAPMPAELIAILLELEQQLGRDRAREARFGPRPIDLDVLVWDDRVIDTPELVVPHPRLVERRFALVPLVELVGEDWIVPGTSASAGELARRVAAQVVELDSATW
jgi:2-amino-4-hydroxy-6-hydroxymethyldihydropteridine diphosphokinase